MKASVTVPGPVVPAKFEVIACAAIWTAGAYLSSGAGVFLFAPFLARLGIDEVVREARQPGTKVLPALSAVDDVGGDVLSY